MDVMWKTKQRGKWMEKSVRNGVEKKNSHSGFRQKFRQKQLLIAETIYSLLVIRVIRAS